MVPGVGKKTAARLLIELKTRLKVPDGVAIGGLSGSAAETSNSVRADVRDALVGLGYGAEEIARVLSDQPETSDSSEMLRQALQRLAAA
jgi:Holliday junction DNA helicase RuvA